MKPVKQTKFGKDEGNCFSACLASILEIPLRLIPNFCVEWPSDWLNKTNEWLAGFGLVLIDFNVEGVPDWDTYWIASGLSPRLTCDHSVVYQGSAMVCDPHPSGDGLKGKPKHGAIILLRDPARWVRVRKQVLLVVEATNSLKPESIQRIIDEVRELE